MLLSFLCFYLKNNVTDAYTITHSVCFFLHSFIFNSDLKSMYRSVNCNYSAWYRINVICFVEVPSGFDGTFQIELITHGALHTHTYTHIHNAHMFAQFCMTMPACLQIVYQPFFNRIQVALSIERSQPFWYANSVHTRARTLYKTFSLGVVNELRH